MKKHSIDTNSINGKLTYIVKFCLYALGIILLASFLFSSILSTVKTMGDALMDTVQITARDIKDTLSSYASIAHSAAVDDVFLNPESTDAEKQACLNKYVKNNYLDSADFIDLNGNSLNGTQYADTSFITECMENGIATYSDIYESSDGSQMLMSFAYPVKIDGELTGITIMTNDATFLTDLIRDVDLDNENELFIINGKGNFVAYKFHKYVTEKRNILSYSGFMKIIGQHMMDGKTGNAIGNFNGLRFVAYAPISGTKNFSICTSVGVLEVMKYTLFANLFCILFVFCFILFARSKVEKITSIITSNIQLCIDRIKLLSEGDFSSEVATITTGDEVQDLSLQNVTLNYVE